MNFLMALIDGIAAFIRRNPLTFLIILLLALLAPALLKGIAMFVLYFILGIFILSFAAMLLLRLYVYRMRRRMEEQMGGARPRGPHRTAEREGEVKIYKRADAPGKRVSKDVGDYVDFEETETRGDNSDR